MPRGCTVTFMAKPACACLFGALLFSATGIAAPPSPAPAPAKPHPPKERRLHVASAEASSYLVNDWNKFQENYLPLYVGDDDPVTAWSLKTEGIGEWLRVHVTPMEGATKLRVKIRNGYQKTPRLWEANSRAKELTVTLLPSKKTVDVTLEDKSDWQEIAVEQPAGAFEAVELKVKSVYAGKKYDDLCISDVQVFVTATSTDNPAFEKQRLDKIATWKKERVAAAKMFKTKLGQTLPIAPQYVVTPPRSAGGGARHDPPVEPADCCCGCRQARARRPARREGKHAPALATARELARTRFASMTAVRVSSRDKRPLPTVDGLCTPDLDGCSRGSAAPRRAPAPDDRRQLGYLDADALALIEQTGLPSFADAMALKPPQCQPARDRRRSPGRLRDPRGAPTRASRRVRALLLVHCGMVDGREGPYPATQPQLLVYGARRPAGDRGRPAMTAALLDWEQRRRGTEAGARRRCSAPSRASRRVDAVVARRQPVKRRGRWFRRWLLSLAPRG